MERLLVIEDVNVIIDDSGIRFRLYGLTTDFENVTRYLFVSETSMSLSVDCGKGIPSMSFDFRRGLFLRDGRIFVREEFFNPLDHNHNYFDDVPMYLIHAKEAFSNEDLAKSFREL